MTHLTAFNLSIDFPLYHSESRSLKKALLGKMSARFGVDKKSRPTVQALRDISFSLKEGDRLGLVGSNGAGKTTLLRTLSGIYQPTMGSLSMEGKLVSLLDPGQGMNMELSGRENIHLRGYFLGLSKSQIRYLEQDVEEFAELGQFLDIPVRNYSSGMVVRLAFAMATAFPPEILLMDEWLLAGDAAFMTKAKARVEGMVRHADILILASHSASTLAEWTNRLIWLDNGHIRADGKPMDVFEAYLPRHDFEELLRGQQMANL
ncbi:ABC transporter ATP-binding protein [Acidocella facilis]|uniref:ABC transporter ATP-binding protein n=1 Tax=Acidocella facilis TaxID=525 RepID=UPI001F20F3F8|nr:ABC transporter ATP-binding protein [Acidocella facilis]